MKNGVEVRRKKGTPQGSPLSPLLSNIVLDELDKELENRGLAFVRYAADFQIYVKAKRSADLASLKLRDGETGEVNGGQVHKQAATLESERSQERS